VSLKQFHKEKKNEEFLKTGTSGHIKKRKLTKQAKAATRF
jgi:hypothetical protein